MSCPFCSLIRHQPKYTSSLSKRLFEADPKCFKFKKAMSNSYGRLVQITVVIAHYVVCRVSFTGVCLGMSIMGTQALHFSYIVLSMEGMPWYRVDFMIALILCIMFYIIVMCLGESAVSITL